MQAANENNSRIKNRRRKFLWSLFAMSLFGFVLYLSGLIADFLENNSLKEIFLSLLKRDYSFSKVAEPPLEFELWEEVSTNILEAPLSLPCETKGEELFIKEAFKVKNFNVENAVFTIKKHGKTLYSTNFKYGGDKKNLFCRGAMKSGGKKFFVYFCEERRIFD